MNKISDEELFLQFIKGDEDAFNQLYERYYKLVYHIAYQLTHCEADAQEIKQEVFVQAYRYRDTLKEPSSFKYWLVAITHNKCKYLFRKNRDVDMSDDLFDMLNRQQENRQTYLPQQQARHENDMDVLYQALYSLTEEQREVIVLKYFGEFKIEEISNIMDIPVGTVKSRMAYAKKLLKGILIQYEKDNDIRLDFKADILGTLTVGLLAKILSVSNVSWKQVKFQVQGATTLMKVTSCSVLLLAGGVGVYNGIQASSTDTPKVRDAFSNLVYQDKEVKDEKQAYTILKQWAHCKEEVSEKSKQEKDEIRPIYESLKSNDNGYYTLLQTTWNDAFE